MSACFVCLSLLPLFHFLPLTIQAAFKRDPLCGLLLNIVGPIPVKRLNPGVIRMRDFPSCFGESGVQVADSSSNATKSSQNLVTCLYQAKLNQSSNCLISITWSKHLMGQGLAIEIEDSSNKCLGKLDIKPWLFSKWKGSRCMEAENTKIEIFWDLSDAKFASSPEPLEGFYVTVLFDCDMVLLLGDMTKEAQQKANSNLSPSKNAVFVAKKEHIFGKTVYCTKAQFCDSGQFHDILIECDTTGLKDPSLEIRIDKRRVLNVKRLGWKFRGNQTISVDGILIEVFWDVYSWLFGGNVGNAVFTFQSCFQASKETQLRGVGFSLLLYAWKND